MFTRSELVLVLFATLFAVAGTVINATRNSPVPETAFQVQKSAFQLPQPTSAPVPMAVQKAEIKKTLKSGPVKININTADLDALMRINGVGETLARRILDSREKAGGFQKLEDLRKVKGIGQKRFDTIVSQLEL